MPKYFFYSGHQWLILLVSPPNSQVVSRANFLYLVHKGGLGAHSQGFGLAAGRIRISIYDTPAWSFHVSQDTQSGYQRPSHEGCLRRLMIFHDFTCAHLFLPMLPINELFWLFFFLQFLLSLLPRRFPVPTQCHHLKSLIKHNQTTNPTSFPPNSSPNVNHIKPLIAPRRRFPCLPGPSSATQGAF